MKNRGFTLPEFIVVMSIIGICASIVLPSLFSRKSNAVVSQPAPAGAIPECRNGYLMNGAQPFIGGDGRAVRC